MKTIFTDVLIIGGGIAGLKAAIAARDIVENVMIVSKGIPGKSGCSLISEGILNGTFSDEDSPELYFNDIVKGSAEVADPELARLMAEKAMDAVLSLQDIGVNFMKDENGLILDLSGGNSVARTVKVNPPGPGCGKVIPIVLGKHVSELDIDILEGYSVVKLLRSHEKVVSAIAYKNDEFVQINFKSAVLATGGGGKLYRSTTNPKGIMGDGYFLAHDVGAPLVDMEYVQFFPSVALKSYLVLPFIFTDGAILLNNKGERFIGRYDPDLMEKTTRDKMSQAIFTEDLEGRGIEGGVVISYKEVPDELLEGKYKDEVEFFRSKGIDLKNENLPIRPACHFLMGGVKINSHCRSGLEGLYACGECAGGTHGANRLAGNALVEALVFGERAGEMAARHALTQEHSEAEANDFIESLPKEYENFDNDIFDHLKELAWNHLGIIRDEKGLEEAIIELNKISEKLNSMKYMGLEQYFEVRNMTHVLKCIAISAKERKESRGAHYRKDYPKTSPAWKKAIVIKADFTTSFEPR